MSSLSEEKVLLEISYDLEFDDLKKAFFSRVFSNKRYVGGLVLFGLMFSFMISWLIYGLLQNFVESHELALIVIISILFIFIVLTPLMNYFVLKKTWTTSHHLPKNFCWQLHESKITIVSVFRHSVYHWQYFYKIIEFQHDFGFYLNSYEYQLLPKRVLTEEQLLFIRELIKRKMNPVKVKLKSS